MDAPQTAVQVQTFTPIFDAVVQDIGLVGASVYGRIWRYCQGRRQCCNAALATIAQSLNISTRTVIRHADTLCEQGYLKDLTPNLRNKPHTYVTTGKLRLIVSFQAEVTQGHTKPSAMTESQSGVTESHPGSDRKSLEETSSRQEETDQERGADAPPTPAGELWPDKVAALGEDPPENPAEVRLKKSRAKLGADPFSVAAHCQERQAEEGTWTVPVHRGLSPACAVVKEATNLSPDTAIREVIDEAIPNNDDALQRWFKVCQAWVLCGWNKRNVGGMLQYYREGRVPTTAPQSGRKGGSSTPRQQEQGEKIQAAMDALFDPETGLSYEVLNAQKR